MIVCESGLRSKTTVGKRPHLEFIIHSSLCNKGYSRKEAETKLLKGNSISKPILSIFHLYLLLPTRRRTDYFHDRIKSTNLLFGSFRSKTRCVKLLFFSFCHAARINIIVVLDALLLVLFFTGFKTKPIFHFKKIE